VSMTMSISGGYLNPAVSFGLWVAGRLDLRRLGQYVAAQLAGAVVAALLVKQLYPAGGVDATSIGVPRIAQDVTLTRAILIEAVLTGLLVSAVFGTAVSRDAPKLGGFAIGLALVPGILVGGPLTGAALNPARAFGPALVALDWHGHLAHWIGPLLGAAAVAFIWAKVLLPLPGDPEP
jgi:aquaporin TIP